MFPIDNPDTHNTAVASIVVPQAISQQGYPNQYEAPREQAPALMEGVEFAIGGPNTLETNAFAIPSEAIIAAGPNATIRVVTLRTARPNGNRSSSNWRGKELMTQAEFSLQDLARIRDSVTNGDPEGFLIPIAPRAIGRDGNIGNLPFLPIETELGNGEDGLEIRFIYTPNDLTWIGPNGELVSRPIDPNAKSSVSSVTLSDQFIQEEVARGAKLGSE